MAHILAHDNIRASSWRHPVPLLIKPESIVISKNNLQFVTSTLYYRSTLRRSHTWICIRINLKSSEKLPQHLTMYFFSLHTQLSTTRLSRTKREWLHCFAGVCLVFLGKQGDYYCSESPRCCWWCQIIMHKQMNLQKRCAAKALRPYQMAEKGTN